MPTGMHSILVGAFHRLLAGCKCEVREGWNGLQCNRGTVLMRVGLEDLEQEFTGVQRGCRTKVQLEAWRNVWA